MYKCKITKPIEEFEKSINSKDGHYRLCRECKREYSNAYYQKTKKDNDLRRLKNSVSASIRKWCQANGNKKTKPTIGYGVDVEAIFNHIGPRSDPGYELGHIIPVAIFDYTNEHHIFLSQHPYNLRWIPAHDNGSKNDVIVCPLISCDTFLSTVADYIGLNSTHDGMRARDITL